MRRHAKTPVIPLAGGCRVEADCWFKPRNRLVTPVRCDRPDFFANLPRKAPAMPHRGRRDLHCRRLALLLKLATWGYMILRDRRLRSLSPGTRKGFRAFPPGPRLALSLRCALRSDTAGRLLYSGLFAIGDICNNPIGGAWHVFSGI